jgi:type 1 glutamine amidotransferase
MFAKLPAVTVETAYVWPSAEQWKDADLVIAYYWNHEWSDEQFKQLDDFLARGGGLVHLHAASIHDSNGDVLAKRLGLAFEQPKMKYRHGVVNLKLFNKADDPILRGFPQSLQFTDESYWLANGDVSKVHVLATTEEAGETWPMAWSFEPNKDSAGKNSGKGRVVCFVMGHYMWTFEDPLFRLLWLRAAAWATGENAKRFEALAVNGVKLAENSKPDPATIAQLKKFVEDVKGKTDQQSFEMIKTLSNSVSADNLPTVELFAISKDGETIRFGFAKLLVDRNSYDAAAHVIVKGLSERKTDRDYMMWKWWETMYGDRQDYKEMSHRITDAFLNIFEHGGQESKTVIAEIFGKNGVEAKMDLPDFKKAIGYSDAPK